MRLGLWTTVAIAVVTLIVATVLILRFYFGDPLGDMRTRADALKLPGDFVLVSESYTVGGFLGSSPHLTRTYHAPWPGLCDSLRGLARRSGQELELGEPARESADRMCTLGAWYPSGWRGWFRNYRRYLLRLTARGGDLANLPGFDRPMGFIVLYPRYDDVPDPRIVIPPGRARIDVELIGYKGQ